jgi:hypothetical protein
MRIHAKTASASLEVQYEPVDVDENGVRLSDQPRKASASWGRYIWPLAVTVLAAVMYFVLMAEDGVIPAQDGADGLSKPVSKPAKTKGGRKRRNKYRTIAEMRAAYNEARTELTDRLKRDYGEEYYWKMFEKTLTNEEGVNVSVSTGRYTFATPGSDPSGGNPSWDRMVRKMKMKLLQVQLHDHNRRKKRRLDEHNQLEHLTAAKNESQLLDRSNNLLSDGAPLYGHRQLQMGVSGDNLTSAGVTFVWVRFPLVVTISWQRRWFCPK